MALKPSEFPFGSENRARQFLAKRCWGHHRRFCIRCRSRKVYRLTEGRYRCGRCRYTFGNFTGRWVGQLNLKAKQWLWILKLFELEVSIRQMAQEVGISYPTALKATDLIRCAILQQAQDFECLREKIDLDVHCLGSRAKRKRHRESYLRAPVFGIVDRNGKVKINLVMSVSPEALLDQNIKVVKRGSIVYTDRVNGYDAFVFRLPGWNRIRGKKRFAAEKVHIDRSEGFWNFAKERLIGFHGISKKRFPLYLKEMEFRYNHRGEALFELLAARICYLVPKL